VSSPIVLIGIGSVASAQQFADSLELANYSDRLLLLADETGAVTEALGCYRGWLAMDRRHRDRYPQTDLNPFLKLLGMILGFGSPGTIPKVLFGYTGDARNEKGAFGRKWVVDSLLQGSKRGRFPQLTEKAFKNVPDTSSLQPFELATLRLQTGLHIVANWGKLGPKDGDLFTRMGGTFVFSNSGECVWSFFDKGILVYADINRTRMTRLHFMLRTNRFGRLKQ
jgi:AhpC/TSA antioxidant enzyme